MNIEKLVNDEELNLEKIFKEIDKLEEINSNNILSSFINNNVFESDFNMTTGYGYNDVGRDKIEKIFADIFKGEDSLVRNQFISGSHAISTALFATLRPNDLLLSITGSLYDTLSSVIGIEKNNSSLASFNIKYDQIDLINDDFDDKKIIDYISTHKVKVIEIQRSKGYSTRKSLIIEKLERIIKKIKKIDKDIIILVDNCYCELVETSSPLEVGADIIVGSLIKNLGAGIASNGAYIVGRKDLIKLCGERLNLPGEGKEVGPSLGANKDILKGLYFSPSVVSSALKVAVLCSKVLRTLGYDVEPQYNDKRADIVQTIIFKDKNKLINWVEGIQSSSPIDSSITPIPELMPGYSDKVIMASGSFTQGSSIELSCDGPIREPFIAYMQGSLSYYYGKQAVIKTIKYLIEKSK